MIDIKTRLVISEIQGLQKAVRDINQVIGGIEDPLAKFRNLQNFRSLEHAREELGRFVVFNGISTKKAAKYFTELEKAYANVTNSMAKASKNWVREDENAAAKEAAILTERRNRIAAFNRFLSSNTRRNNVSQFNDPNAGIRERERTGKEFASKLRQRLEREVAEEARASKAKMAIADQEARAQGGHLRQLFEINEKQKKAKEAADRIANKQAGQQGDSLRQLFEINQKQKKDQDAKAAAASKAQKEQDERQADLSLTAHKQRLAVVSAIEAKQKSIANQVSKGLNTEKEHNELVDKVNQAAGKQLRQRTTIGTDFQNQVASFVSADSQALADQLFRDPNFVASLNKNARQLIGNSNDSTFQRQQQLKAAQMAAQAALSGSGGGGGSPPGGGPPSNPPNNPPDDRFKKAKKDIDEMNKALHVSRNSLNSFGSAAGLALRRFVAFQIGAQALYSLVGAFTQGAGEAIKFEQELTKIQQTLDESDAGVQNLSDTMRKLARDVGVSAVEIAAGVRTFAQAGFDQVKDLEQVASLISKVPLSASFDNINETVEGSIAILGQFGGSLNDLNYIFDLTNQFSKDFTIEAKDIFTAVQRAGASFSIAGGNVEEFVSLLSILRDATRESGEVLGTFFKTGINQLFRPQAQKQLQQLGIDTKTGITDQLTQLGKKLFSDDSQFNSLQILEVVRTLVDDSRQFPRLLATIRQLSQDKVLNKIENTKQNVAGSFLKDTEKRIDDFGVSLKRAGQTIIDIFNDIIQNPAIKQLAKDFADLTETVVRFIRVASPALPALLAGGVGTIFPTARQHFSNAAQFFVGGFGARNESRAVAGSVRSTASNRRVKGQNLQSEILAAQEGIVPLSRGQIAQLGIGVGISAVASLIQKYSADQEVKNFTGAISSAGLAFTVLSSVGVGPAGAALAGFAVGLNALSDNIVKTRKEIFEREFKTVKNPESRVAALLGNDFAPFLGRGQESGVTTVSNFVPKVLGTLVSNAEAAFSNNSDTNLRSLVEQAKTPFFNLHLSKNEKELAKNEELLRRINSPDDAVGSRLRGELERFALKTFDEEKLKGGEGNDVNKRVRLALLEFVKKTFKTDNSFTAQIVNSVFSGFKVPKGGFRDDLIGPMREFANGVKLFLNEFNDVITNMSEKFQAAENRLGRFGVSSTSDVNIAGVSRIDVARIPFVGAVSKNVSAIPDIFKQALSKPGFREALRLATEGSTDDEVFTFRQRLSENASLGKGNDDIKKFIDQSFGPALVLLSQLSGKKEEDIVKDLLDNTSGFIDFVTKFSEGLGENGDVVKKLTDRFNEIIGVMNAQIEAQRRITESARNLRNEIFDLNQKIQGFRNNIVQSNVEQDQLVSGRNNPTALGQSILDNLLVAGNTDQIIGNVTSSREELGKAFANAFQTNLFDNSISNRQESTEALLRAQKEYANAQQQVTQQITILESNLTSAGQAAEIFKTELLGLRSTVDSAGKTIASLEKKDLNSIIFSIGKFARESKGFTDVGGGLNKLNTKEFDFVQKGLELLNNFKLPGGLSGADVLGDINKALGVPALASVLRAASGGKLSQSEAETQINKQIADALNKQQAAQQFEQDLRIELIRLLTTQVDDRNAQLEQLREQNISLSAIKASLVDGSGIRQSLFDIYAQVSKLFKDIQPVSIEDKKSTNAGSADGTQANGFKIPPYARKLFEEYFPKDPFLQQLQSVPDNYSVTTVPMPAFGGDKEAKFRKWYDGIAASNGLNPDPDDPAHQYDYRRAFMAGARPGADGHWPSRFKLANHPNRFVDGVDTITGQSLTPYPDTSPTRTSYANVPTFRELNRRHGRFASPATKAQQETVAVTASPNVSFDQFVKLNDILNGMNANVMAMKETLDKIANAPAIHMELEIKPMQVNVAVAVPDIMKLAGSTIANQVIAKIAPAISEAFGVVSDEAKSKFDSGTTGFAPEVD